MYIHIDCNNFFVSCELISRPELNGTPVVVANNNENNGGIILALNKEAKAAGLKRGNPIFQVSELIKAKKVTIIDVHHNLYHQISHQIMDVVRKTEMVLGFVQYSVDEFFGEMPDDDPTRLRKYLQQLKDIISQEAHIPVSCGAGTTYTLAKTATSFAKQYAGYKGICVITPVKREQALRILPIEKVWGIGRRSFKSLHEAGVKTAYDYTLMKEGWIRKHFGLTGINTWKELNGFPAISITGHNERQKSIMYSRTFARMTDSKNVLIRELSNYATAATRRMREQKAMCKQVTIFLATNRHREDLPQYKTDTTLTLSSFTADSSVIIEAVQMLLDRIFQEGFMYKQAGVILSNLQHSTAVQLNLFEPEQTTNTARQERLMQAIDGINRKFGSNQIHFAIQGHDAEEEELAGFMRPHKVEDESND